MSDSESPEQKLQSIFKGNDIGGNVTTGDITQTIINISNLSNKNLTKLPTITWHEVCRQMLAKHPLRQHATEEDCELDIYVPLGLMERKQQQRRPANQDLPMEEVYKEKEEKDKEKEEITRRFEHTQFLEHIGLSNNQAESTKSIAIIGEPGAGKSTLLEKIAKEIDAQDKDLPICISLANLEGLTLEEYLEQKWLKDALLIIEELVPQAELSIRNVPEELKEALVKQFTKTQQGGVWLLLDGLDEMKANSPTEALTNIEKQIGSGYLAKARVVLSCRTNVWDANLTNPFSKFDIYKTLEFEDFQRDNFIQQWFNTSKNPQLGTDLTSKLQETGKERIRELVKNPLRLVLLCYIWTLQQGQLPETKAEFYQRYLPYFYNWKKNIKDLTRQSEKRTELHQALGNLAIEAIKSGSRYRLKESLACKEMGEELFRLAEALGWLNIVDRDLATEEVVYAFFHPTFQEYFAACAIDDWDFFLPRDHVDEPVEGKKEEYRIFEPKWKEVILLWLGREDIAQEEKEKFINALVDFEDDCSLGKAENIDKGFYQYRAYFLAAAATHEFKECSRTKEIVEKIVEWVFGNIISDIKTSAETALTETNRVETIANLVKLIESTSDESLRSQAVESLGKIGAGNENAIAALVLVINSTNNKYVLRQAVENLEKIGAGNENAIVAFFKIIESTSYEYVFWHAAESLRKIGARNDDLIEALVQVINSSSDKYIRWQAAKVLGEIDPRNAVAIETLVKAINSTSNESHHVTLAKVLGEISPRNAVAIETLVKAINSTSDELTRWQAAESLGKIGAGNEKVIATLVKVIESTNNNYVLRQAAKSLEHIASGNEKVIEALIELIDSTNNENVLRQVAKSLGKINPGNKKAIHALVNSIESASDRWDRWEVTESLENIASGNEVAITAIIELIDSTNNEDVLRQAAECLGKIDPENKKAIDALVDLIKSASDRWDRWEAAECLGEIDPGNKKAIDALVDLINSPNNGDYFDEYIRWQVAASLEKNDPGNKKAIDTLVDLIESTSNEYVLRQAAKCLGKISVGNEVVIEALIELIDSTNNEDVHWQVAEILGKIGAGNKDVIEALAKVINSTSDRVVFSGAIESLKKILTKSFMPKVINTLKNTKKQEALEILWNCAQNLSYPDFYKAWHS
jgi:HEAT repeat protein/energy-coupling factor transporter ATP-binding protein EcfA2